MRVQTVHLEIVTAGSSAAALITCYRQHGLSRVKVPASAGRVYAAVDAYGVVITEVSTGDERRRA